MATQLASRAKYGVLSTQLPKQAWSSFVPSLFQAFVLVVGHNLLSCVCEGGLLRKPPLKRAGTNSARNYIFMRDTSLRADRRSVCARTGVA